VNAHYTPGAAAQKPLFWWWARFGDRQHAYREGIGFRSVCDQLRWTASLVADPTAPVCPECRAIVWSLTEAARDHVVNAEAAADHADTEWRLLRDTGRRVPSDV
jgi:hypothetical protein